MLNEERGSKIEETSAEDVEKEDRWIGFHRTIVETSHRGGVKLEEKKKNEQPNIISTIKAKDTQKTESSSMSFNTTTTTTVMQVNLITTYHLPPSHPASQPAILHKPPFSTLDMM